MNDQVVSIPTLPPTSSSGAKVAPDTVVLDGLRLKSGTLATSRFGDDRWDLAPALLSYRRRRLALTWSTCPDPRLVLALKELVYRRLRHRASRGTAKRWSVGTAYTHVQKAMMLDRTLRSEQGVGLLDATQINLDAWLVTARARVGPPTVRHFIETMRLLYDEGTHLPSALAFRPFGTRSARVVSRWEKSDENMTPRIPENVLQGVMSWAFRYMIDFAPEIIAAVRSGCLAGAPSLPRPRYPLDTPSGARSLLLRVGILRDWMRTHDVTLPTTSPGNLQPRREALGVLLDDASGGHAVWLAGLARMLGYGREHLRLADVPDDAVRALEALAREFGTDVGRARREAPLSLLPLHGCTLAGRELQRQVERLTLACYAVIAFLSGMRYGEALGLETTCKEIDFDEYGAPVRYRVVGRVHKGHGAGPGKEVAWVVLEEVHRAIDVLCELRAALGVSGDGPLFVQIGTEGKILPLPYEAVGYDRWNEAFIPTANALAAASDGQLAPIPHHNGEPWPLSVRQFRRTLAWFIANRPFGIVAGAIQFKHASVAVTQGYAGTSASGFTQEVQAEREMANLGILEAMYEDYERGIAPVGPHAGALTRKFGAIAAEAARFGGTILERDERVRALLRQTAKTLYVGALNDCHYDPDKALCRRASRGGAASGGAEPAGVDDGDGPAFSLCQPGVCANSILRQEHVAVWLRALDDIRVRREQAGPSSSAGQKAIWDAEEQRILAIISPFLEAANGA